MWNRLKTINVPHNMVYRMLAGLHFGAALGFDKTTVYALLALGYALLAIEHSADHQ